MYRPSFTIVIVCICTALCLASCQYLQDESKQDTNKTPAQTETAETPKKQPAGVLSIGSLSANGEHTLIEGASHSPMCKVSVEMEYPLGGNTGNISLGKLQQTFMGTLPENMRGNTPKNAANNYVEAYIANYKKEMEPHRKMAKRKDNTWMNYESKVTIKSLYNKHNFWGYTINDYSFTGGAHGMHTTGYNVIDLNSGKLLSLKSLFAEKDYPIINRLLRQQLADDRGCTIEQLAGQSFETENIVIDDNFMISDSGITWVFNPYDIAPYSTGTVYITLPYRAILGYLIADSPVKRILK